jgi:DNA polymerase
MFIGEAPGWHEDQQGRPFVGPAGQFLDQLLASIGLKRGQVYIANVIKCRPTSNRDPLPTEIQNCNPWLERQIELIQPRVIVTLGRYSMAKFFPGKSISKIHGTAQKRDGVTYFAMYHPAAALHQQRLRQQIEADMLKIPGLLQQTDAVQVEEPAQQLNLF